MQSLWQRLRNFLYNEDRAVASLGGAPRQETISSEIGRGAANNQPLAEAAEQILDAIQPGHCENAMKNADRLNSVDDAKQG